MEEKDTRAATPHPRTMVCNDPNCGVHALHDKPPPSDPSFGRVCGCGAIWLTQGFHALRDMGGTMHRRGAPCYVDPAPPAAVASEQPPARPPDSVSESLREARRLLGEARKGIWNARIRIQILTDRMRGCDAEVKDGVRSDTDGHALSLFEGEAWMEEHQGQIAKLDAFLRSDGERS